MERMLELPELTLPVAQQLALDECLLLAAEPQADREYFRLWELSSPAVVLGRGSRWQEEVDVRACEASSIPILRRCSGGATIVGGPGCLFYSVVISMQKRPELRVLDAAHQFVLERINRALLSLGLNSRVAGTSDLAVVRDGQLLKVSGNSLRLRRDHLLYHGTLLYQADLPLVARLLKTPPRQPDYRDDRSHEQFVTNLNVAGDRLRAALRDAWSPTTTSTAWPQSATEELARTKYVTDEWNQRL